MYTVKPSRLWRNVRLNSKKQFMRRRLDRKHRDGKITEKQRDMAWSVFIAKIKRSKRSNIRRR